MITIPPQTENNHSQDTPKDGLAQKRELLDPIEERPRPIISLDEEDLKELKKSRTDYQRLLSLKNNQEKLSSLDNPAINPRILRGGEFKH